MDVEGLRHGYSESNVERNGIIAHRKLKCKPNMLITRRLEFDSGHRIPNHESQCRHLHGHRYAIEVTLSGEIIETEGAPDQGMVMDYSYVKHIAQKELVDLWDHAFLVYKNDHAVLDFLKSMPGHKTVVLDVIPTAENLALAAFGILDAAYARKGLRLARVRLYETPNNWADAIKNNIDFRDPFVI